VALAFCVAPPSRPPRGAGVVVRTSCPGAPRSPIRGPGPAEVRELVSAPPPRPPWAPPLRRTCLPAACLPAGCGGSGDGAPCPPWVCCVGVGATPVSSRGSTAGGGPALVVAAGATAVVGAVGAAGCVGVGVGLCAQGWGVGGLPYPPWGCRLLGPGGGCGASPPSTSRRASLCARGVQGARRG